MIVIGHRGARGLAPENTLASLQAGLAAGVAGVEVDVRLTKDGVVILHHDPSLQHQPAHRITDYSFADIQQFKPDITTLDAAIRAVKRQVPLYIEVKPGEPTAPVVTVVQQFLADGWLASDFWFVSFDLTALKELQQALPAIPRVVNDRWSFTRATHRARQVDTSYIAIGRRALWWGPIWLASHSRYHLLSYAVNNPRSAQRWARAGLYAIYTDFPDRFRSLP